MPNTSSEAYTVSYHPEIVEFIETKALFSNQLEKSYAKHKYLLVKEKGNSEYHSHFQGAIKMVKSVRSDSFRRSFHNKVLKDIEISCLKIALKLKPVTRDFKCALGYCLKEIEGDVTLDDVTTNFDLSELLEAQKYYKDIKTKKLIGCDKIRVNNRNIHVICKKYFDAHEDRYEYVTLLKNKTMRIGRDQIIILLSDMILDGYWMANLIDTRRVNSRIDFIRSYLQGNMYEFINTMSNNSSTIDDAQLRRALDDPY